MNRRGGPIRVVVVDDHLVVRRGLAALVDTTTDVVVVGEASGGASGVAVVEDLRPDLVLMDLAMPRVDGVEATRRIKARRPDVRVVVLTSFGDQARVAAALDAGADGYLLKHASADELLDAIRDTVGGGAALDPDVARVVIDLRRDGLEDASPLTDREEEVLLLVCEGLANKQIASRLGITTRTVKSHLSNVFQRLDVDDRTQAAMWARDYLLDPSPPPTSGG